MKSVKVTAKNKQHYIDLGYIDNSTPIGHEFKIKKSDYFASKSIKLYSHWMLLESKPYKMACGDYVPTDEQLNKLKEVCAYLTKQLEYKKSIEHYKVKLIVNMIKYDLPGSYLDRLREIESTPSNQRTDTYEYLVLCYGEEEGRRRFEKKSESRKGDKNPAYNHGGRLSPFSKNFVGYEGLSDLEKEDRIAELYEQQAKSLRENGNIDTTLEYYLKRGHSEEEAKKLLSERQRTFSLEKCIEKYGEDEGRRVWKERQEKWINTLESKSYEERLEINRKKVWKGGMISNLEKEIREELSKHINGLQFQFRIVPHDDLLTSYFYDIKYGNKIIEVNGDFWHANPELYEGDEILYRWLSAEDIWKKDKKKLDLAKDHGFEVLVVWEKDYKEDKDKVINECVKFLKRSNESSLTA